MSTAKSMLILFAILVCSWVFGFFGLAGLPGMNEVAAAILSSCFSLFCASIYLIILGVA